MKSTSFSVSLLVCQLIAICVLSACAGKYQASDSLGKEIAIEPNREAVLGKDTKPIRVRLGEIRALVGSQSHDHQELVAKARTHLENLVGQYHKVFVLVEHDPSSAEAELSCDLLSVNAVEPYTVTTKTSSSAKGGAADGKSIKKYKGMEWSVQIKFTPVNARLEGQSTGSAKSLVRVENGIDEARLNDFKSLFVFESSVQVEGLGLTDTDRDTVLRNALAAALNNSLVPLASRIADSGTPITKGNPNDPPTEDK